MNTISAPILDNFISKAQSYPDLLNQAEKDVLLSIIDKLQGIAVCGNDERRELWLTVERGSIEDFGDYDDYLENEILESKEDFKKVWKEEYPDSVKWYLLSITHYNEEYFIFIDSKLTLHIKNVPSEINESFNNQLISWIDEAVDKCTDWLNKDTAEYNEYINQRLPYTKLIPDSPQEFEEWFGKREWQFGHPWEVCRGGNSTHISLYVDKRADGWRLSLAGKSSSRVAETVRFAIALYNHNIPFKLWDGKEILAMVFGTDYIGIVPEGITPIYCHSYFPKKDQIVDFMNFPVENRDKIVKTTYWYPIEEIRLFED